MRTLQITIQNYLERQRSLSEKSRASYAFGLNIFAELINKEPASLTHQDLSRFITYLLDEKYSDSTVSMYASAVVGFFEWMAFEKIWNGNMADIRYVSRKEKPKIIQETPVYDFRIIAALVQWAIHG